MDKIDLYAWIGEDELGTGVTGLKQAVVPAGVIPMVATNLEKMNQEYIVKQLQNQSNMFGKKIRLCKFVLQEDVITLEPKKEPNDN